MLDCALSLDRPLGELVFKSLVEHSFAELNVKLWSKDVFRTVVLTMQFDFLLLKLALLETLIFVEIFERHCWSILICHVNELLYVEFDFKI